MPARAERAAKARLLPVDTAAQEEATAAKAATRGARDTARRRRSPQRASGSARRERSTLRWILVLKLERGTNYFQQRYVTHNMASSPKV